MGAINRLIAVEAGIAEALHRFGYAFEVQHGTDFRFRCCTRPGEFWRAQVLAHPDVVQLYVFLTDARYLERYQPQVLEIVCRLNDAASVLGSWEFQWDSGAVRYHAAVDLREQEDIATAVERQLNALKFPVSLWSKCYQHVGKSKVSATAIVSASLIAEGCRYDDVSDETRRVLFRVHRPVSSTHGDSLEVERCLAILLEELSDHSSK